MTAENPKATYACINYGEAYCPKEEGRAGRYINKSNKIKTFRNSVTAKHINNSRFALPVYDENGEVERYNVFHASMLIRHDADGKMYLYDIMDIKKETSNPFES